ncbi:uncharacterized protein EI90DRAFT_3134325 [Cantharellus anzutake]|uniref:uncharacterized protein n=1 Tax=Cantharellus anzutake TaxID=1750568 RepID=UPI001908AEB6|nr:uncharacterized protein EI90DRAFT_3134325 [Cantharellus anzutake]KAF8316508.1 hypothetical protein EI90DRAFT_3134325 [Cantharellus anzutake]
MFTLLLLSFLIVSATATGAGGAGNARSKRSINDTGSAIMAGGVGKCHRDDRRRRPETCRGPPLVGIILGFIFGAFFLGILVWAIIWWWSKRRKKLGVSPVNAKGRARDLEASPPAPLRKVEKPWLPFSVARLFSKYKRVPDPPDTPRIVIDDITDVEAKKSGLHRNGSQFAALPSLSSEASVPLPPYQSTSSTPEPNITSPKLAPIRVPSDDNAPASPSPSSSLPKLPAPELPPPLTMPFLRTSSEL